MNPIELYEALKTAISTIDVLNDALASAECWSDREWSEIDRENTERKALVAKARGEA